MVSFMVTITNRRVTHFALPIWRTRKCWRVRMLHWNDLMTRMHSSRMRTACLLPYKGGGSLSGGVLYPGGLCLKPSWTDTPQTETPGQRPPWTEFPLDGDPQVMWPLMHAGTETPPVDRQIPVKTLPSPRLRLRGVIIHKCRWIIASSLLFEVYCSFFLI